MPLKGDSKKCTRQILLDACCLINLYATDRIQEIARTVPFHCNGAGFILENEILFVKGTDAAGESEMDFQIVQSSLIEEGLIRVCNPVKAEQTTILQLSAQFMLDQGEIISGAMAICRGYGLATDDIAARRDLRCFAPDLNLFSTAELLKAWIEEASIPCREAGHVLQLIESRARFVPSRRDPLREWWRELSKQRL